MPPVARIEAAAYTLPTTTPESDGTLEWNSTTLVVVHAQAADQRGWGYTYAHRACLEVIHDLLAPVVIGSDALDVTRAWNAMRRTVRNQGRPGIAATSIAAVDNALWDLKARILNLPLVTLLGGTRDAIDAYGSGGFTSYSDAQLQQQFAGWAEMGLRMMKMKVGREPDRDPARVRAARAAIGDDCELFVDANGGYSRKQALALAERFAQDSRVSWFEEPVSSDDLAGLGLLVQRAPSAMDIAAGEYGYDLHYFRRMLEARAVDVLQVDGSRCCGISGFMRASALCEAFGMPLSAHTAPTLHAHLCCAATPARHVEYFHDHARIEQMLFDGTLVPNGGTLKPDLSRPGLGVAFKTPDGEPYRV
jgi:L-alanine-DL-glutamate epimerase-like enolase superfamily enzyme